MKDSYSDLLPREGNFNFQICCHLDSDGERCPDPATIEAHIFEDESTTSELTANWHIVYLCKRHADFRGIRIEETQNYN